MLLLSFLLSWITPLLPGEYVLPSEQINVIALDTTDGKTSFYQQKGTSFIAYDLAFRTEKTYPEHNKFHRPYKTYSAFWKPQNKPLSLKTISKNKILIYTKAIRPTLYSDFQGKVWTIKTEKSDLTDIFRFLNPSTIAWQALRESKEKGAFSYQIPTAQGTKSFLTTISRKRENYLYDFGVLTMDFGAGKRAYFYCPLIENPDVESDPPIYSFIPLEEQTLTFPYYGRLEEVATEVNYCIDLDHNPINSFLKVCEGGRCNLINLFGQKLLPKSYPYISTNDYIIIAKDGKDIDIYNGYHQKMNVGTVKAVHFYDKGVEVLNEHGVNYYNVFSQVVKEFPDTSIPMCGNGEWEWGYFVRKNKYTGSYSLESFYHKHPLADRSPDEEVHALKAIKGNDNTVQAYLSVEKNSCKGLYMYNFTEGKDEKITGRELLPMAYDVIYYHATFNHQPFFYIEKEGKKGFYPPQKDPIYDHLEQVSAFFYRFERDGIKGYLDSFSFKEFVNETIRK
ncbi:hypothetical protein [uncultured Capnocytophaga sp.]|uniref:hypothetical protein n=1 Tax=uncultured Capnocytophaga sp. TaxID=159273 RepID=UPI00260B21B1|nr:hypothetical protein [uncultured Capnocytophaga sp.]